MKTITKLLNALKKSMFGSVSDVYWWSGTWTAPSDGMLVLRITPSANWWYWYINDTSVNSITGTWSHQFRGNFNGGAETKVIPVKKGAKLSTVQLDGINSINCLFYPLTIGGGYGITSFMSTVLSAISSFVRRWSHEVRNGLVKENTSGGYILKSCDASCKRSKFGINRHRYTEWSNGQSREFGNNTKWELGAQCNWCIQCHNCNNSLPKHIKFTNERNIRGSGVLHDIALISERGCSYVEG